MAAQPSGQPAPGSAANPGTNSGLHRVRNVSEIVAAEALVPSISGQRDRDVAPRFARDVERGNARGIREWLIEGGHEQVRQFVESRLDQIRMVLGRELPRGQRRGVQLVVAGCPEPDGGCENRRLHGLRHVRDDQAGIDPTGQKRAERHLAFQALAHTRGDLHFDLGDGRLLTAFEVIEVLNVPVLTEPGAAAGRLEPVAGFELPHAAVHRVGSDHVAETEIALHLGPIDSPVP
jgi:hypothetical protein